MTLCPHKPPTAPPRLAPARPALGVGRRGDKARARLTGARAWAGLTLHPGLRYVTCTRCEPRAATHPTQARPHTPQQQVPGRG